ncbi:DUF6308 family protein [Kitasatospora sp. NBC_00315]|uniref:DUF6308 family protein n=1 Tax=Kitasatospora sp. NBC_00315 TaxID=2975963 RepID=UPI0032569217
MPDRSDEFTARLRALLSAPEAAADLRRYFCTRAADGRAPAYTGARFEHLDGGGDRPGVADTLTAADLAAVQTLSVTVPARAAIALLEGDLGVTLAGLLAGIPRDLDLAEAEPGVLAAGSPADLAWHLLKEEPGLGWVMTGKLLARKRPRLIPVYDHVVRCAVGRPDSYWLSLRQALAADGGALHEQLLALRATADVPRTVSAIRVCDVVLWMRHVTGHQAKGCPGVAVQPR